MSELVELAEMRDIPDQRMDMATESMDMSESMELAEMPDLSAMEDTNNSNGNSTDHHMEDNSNNSSTEHVDHQQIGRKRQRSGSATPEEQNMVHNLMQHQLHQAQLAQTEMLQKYAEEQNSGDDRAALLLRVYLKMKLGKYI